MHRSMGRRLLFVLCTLAAYAGAAAGCGGTAAPSGPAAERTAGPLASRPVTLTATDLRLGDATFATPDGARELPVGPRRPDPDDVRGRPVGPRDGVGAGASCPGQDLMPDGANTRLLVSATLCLLDAERVNAGLPPFRQDGRLAAAALGHARDMVAREYFDHDTPEGRGVVDRLRASGYVRDDRYWTVGENLAWGSGDLATPRSIVAAWMGSPGHRANILRDTFAQIGFGVVAGTPRSGTGAGATYATDFGAHGALAATELRRHTRAVARRAAQARAARAGRARARARAAARRQAHARARARAAARRLRQARSTRADRPRARHGTPLSHR